MDYANIEVFYDENPKRRRSGEADYGVGWRGPDGASWPRWRVSYIQATGEVYAVALRGSGPVQVLGVVPPDDADIYYKTLDKTLSGWSDEGDRPLSWVRERLKRTASKEAQT